MHFKVKMKLNPRIEIEAIFDEANLQDNIRFAGALLEFEGKCGFCDSDDIVLRTRVTKEKGYKFTEFICRKCGAKRPMGEYKGGGYFLKAWEEKYNGEAAAEQS